MHDNLVANKSKDFALEIIRLYRKLVDYRCPRDLSSQLLRSGTSIGANIREGEDAQSRADFVARYNIALKEANETDYWLDLLHDAGYIPDSHYDYLSPRCKDIVYMLISILKSTNENKKEIH